MSANCKCLENRGGGEEPFKLFPLTADHYEYPWYISGAASGASPSSNEPYTCFWRRRYKVSIQTHAYSLAHLLMHARTHAGRTRWKKRKRGIGRKRHPYTCKLSTLEALEPVFNEQMAEEEGEPGRQLERDVTQKEKERRARREGEANERRERRKRKSKSPGGGQGRQGEWRTRKGGKNGREREEYKPLSKSWFTPHSPETP